MLLVDDFGFHAKDIPKMSSRLSPYKQKFHAELSSACLMNLTELGDKAQEGYDSDEDIEAMRLFNHNPSGCLYHYHEKNMSTNLPCYK